MKLWLSITLSTTANTVSTLLFWGPMYSSPSEISLSDSLARVQNTSISIPLGMSKTVKNGWNCIFFFSFRISTPGLCVLRPTEGWLGGHSRCNLKSVNFIFFSKQGGTEDCWVEWRFWIGQFCPLWRHSAMDGDIFGASTARVGVVLAFYWVKITMPLGRGRDGPPLARSGPFHNAHSTTAGKSCRVKRRGAGPPH